MGLNKERDIKKLRRWVEPVLAFDIYCSRCQTMLTVQASSAMLAAYNAYGNDWRATVSGEPLCPECSKKGGLS